MALKPCKECGQMISKSAANCPKCGAPAPKKTSLGTWIVGAVMLVLVLKCTSSMESGSTTPKPAPAAASSVSHGIAQSPANTTPPGWSYSQDADAITGKNMMFASLNSSNSLQLEFPYAGSNYGRLSIRQHPQYGLDVIMSVQKGQIICRSYDGCSVKVRFDQTPAVSFSANGPEDHSSTTIFLSPASKFIASARKARRIIVQITMYQAGVQTLEFDTGTDLVWPPK